MAESLRYADRLWLVLGCTGLRGCGRSVPLGFGPAVTLFGPAATARDLERRLVCSACGGRRGRVQVAADPRPEGAREADGPRPETRASLPPSPPGRE